MLRMVMGRYPAPLPEVLRPEPGLPKSVLDLGCGSGCWLLDVATDFPHTECVGVDLVPMQARRRPLPPNVRTEVDDINLGLEHFYGASPAGAAAEPDPRRPVQRRAHAPHQHRRASAPPCPAARA